MDKNITDLVHIWYIRVITCSRNSPFWCGPLFIIVFRTACQCSVLRQMKDPHVLESYFTKLLSNIICPLTSGCSRIALPSRFPTKLVSRYFTATCQNPPVFFVAQQPNSGLERLTVNVSTSHTQTHTQPVALLWTSDQLVAEAAIHKINTTDYHPFPKRNSNSRSRHSSRFRTTP
jgi:hypothetical protein